MTKEVKYPSLVNSVIQVRQGVHTRVRKEYGEVAVKTGIPIPIERKLIEERVLHTLGHESFFGFKVPKIVGSGVRHLDFNLLEGSLAIEILADQNMPVRAERWYSIGVGLARAENYLQAHANEIFEGLLSTQKQCANIMRERKYQGLFIGEEDELTWVSMGDVGVRNIILGETDTYLLDFEFAHFSRRARDVGQLVSQLISLGVAELAIAVEAGYLNTTPSAGADLYFWKSAFANYYGVIYGKN